MKGDLSMRQIRLYLLTTLVLYLLFSLFAYGAYADQVQLDFLGGWGQFESAGDVAWTSGYTGSDYNWTTPTTWSAATSEGWHWGYSAPTSDDTLGIGWRRETTEGVNPGTNIVYKLVDNPGQSSGKCQYFALRGTSGQERAVARLEPSSSLPVGTGPYDIHVGDTVELVVGYYSISDNTAPAEYQLTFDGYPDTVTLDSQHNSIQFQVPAGATSILPAILIHATDSLVGKEAGIYVDDVHLYVKRGGQYLTREIPVAKNRSIHTTKIDFDSAIDDLYKTACDYDHVVLKKEEDYKYAAQLKYYNPEIKVYMREPAGTIVDWRWGQTSDYWYVYGPFSYLYALNNHPEWMYPDQNNPGSYLNKYFVWYYARTYDSLYQSTWLDKVVEKLGWYKLDGIFTDDLTCETSLPRDASQLQSFVHAAVPQLRSSGLTFIEDIGQSNTDSYPSNVLVNPSWQTTTQYPPSSGYSDNSSFSVPDTFNQQPSFFKRSWYQRGGNWIEKVFL